MQDRIKVGVLISGRGSNLQALLISSLNKYSLFEIVIVGTNNFHAAGLKWAQIANIQNFITVHNAHSDNEKLITRKFNEANVNLICLAGYMKILSPDFVNDWKGKILNIHPSLLPAFKGVDAQKQALDSGVNITGCTVHYVTEELDSGEILGQHSCPISEDDTVEILSEKIRNYEHTLYPEVLNKVSRKLLEKKND